MLFEGSRVGGRRRHRWGPPALHGVALVVLMALLFVFSSVGAAIASPSAARDASAGSSGPLPPGVTGSSKSGTVGVAARCLDGYASSDAYDPADGYVYAVGGDAFNGNSAIFTVKPPCTVIKTIQTGNADNSDLAGVAYDPLTKEVVVTDIFAGAIYVLKGTSIVKTIPAGIANGGGNLAWDGAIGSVLIPDWFGVTVLHLELVNGRTEATVSPDEFDRSGFSFGNWPVAELVADGYIFSAGNRVDVFNDRTLAYLGAFRDRGAGDDGDAPETLAWDPVMSVVVMGGGTYSVAFLDVTSIASGKFTVSHLAYRGLLNDGVWDVAYSPATQLIYLTQFSGADVLMLSHTGELTHVDLGKSAVDKLTGLAYDPVDQDMYVCSWGPPALYVIY